MEIVDTRTSRAARRPGATFSHGTGWLPGLVRTGVLTIVTGGDWPDDDVPTVDHFEIRRRVMANTDPDASDQRHGLAISGGAIVSLAGLAALIIFMVQNTDDVNVEFLAWDFTWSVWLLTLVSALIGALVWFGLGVLRRHRRRQERRADRRD